MSVVLDRLGKRVRKLAQLAERIVEELEAIDVTIERFKQGGLDSLEVAARDRRSDVEQRLLTAEAERGVTTLRITSGPNGWTVSISDRSLFHLSPQLGALLQVLADRSREAGDGLVGWRSTSEIAAALGELTGTPVPAANVAKIVFRLREALLAVGENAALIRSSRRHGFRFALRVERSKDPS